MRLHHFFKECKEKGVLKHLSIYIVSVWVFLQVLAVISEPLNIPKVVTTYSVLILLLGFPVYIFLLWKFRIKPLNLEEVSQLKYEDDINHASSKSAVEIDMDENGPIVKRQFNKKFQRAYFIGLGVIGTLTILVAGLIIQTNIRKNETSSVVMPLVSEEVSDKIAILNFDNNTANKDLDIVGKMAVDWIMHGITENRIAQVISPKIIDDYSKILKASIVPASGDNVFTKHLKPSKIIIGNFYLKGGRLLFQSSITDENMNKTLIAFKPVECDVNAPLDCVEALKQRILGYLVTEERPLEKLQESPPNFEAYQNLLKADSNYDNSDEYLRYLNAAIAADDTYFEAKVDRLAHYYNTGRYKVADSLLDRLSKESGTNKRQLNLLKMYEALLQGNNRNTYKYLKREYEITPFDLETNSSTMTVAKQFVNRPEDVAPIFDAISMEGMDLADCVHCSFRYLIKAQSAVELGEFEQAITTLEPFAKAKGQRRLKEVLIRAYIKSGKPNDTIKRLLSTFSHELNPSQWRELALFTAKEYTFLGADETATVYLDQLISSFENAPKSNKDFQLLANAHFYKNDYKKAQHYYKKFLALDPPRKTNSYADLAIAYHKDKQTNMAKETIEKIQQERSDYDYGSVDYALARYHAAIAEDDMAVKFLYKAVAAGRRYSHDAYQHELFFKPYLGTNDFEKILSFWK